MKHLHGKSLLDQYIKPVTRLYIDQAITDEAGTHEIRVCIKRIRAMLVLHQDLAEVQPGSSQLDDRLKQLNKALAARRDHDILLALLERLIANIDDTSMGLLFDTTKTQLSASSLQELVDVSRIEQLGAEILNLYQAFPLIDIRVKNIRNYLKKSLRKTCRKAQRTLRSADCSALHAWRKQVKQLYYQVQALHTVTRKSPVPVKILEKLGARLGDIHDLCVLESSLQQQQASNPLLIPAETYAQAYALLDNKRARLLKKCRRLYTKACVR